MDNLISFYNSVKSYLPKPDPNPVKKDFDNDDYLSLPPLELSTCKKNEKPEKASDFQTNSLCFIKDLVKKIPSVSNNTGTKVEIRLSNTVKTNITFFIFVINELINEMETQKSYNKTYVFVFFLFFLYFINFRLGQIVLYSVFFHLRETSDQLSTIFQKLVENSMTYSVVQLDSIATELSKNSDNSITVLPDAVKGQIKLNKIQFLDYSFMDTFSSVLSDIMKNNNATPSTPSSPSTPSTNTQIQDIVQKTEEAKKVFNDAKKKEKDETDADVNAGQTLNHVITEKSDAITNATAAKTAANNAAKKYGEANDDHNNKARIQAEITNKLIEYDQLKNNIGYEIQRTIATGNMNYYPNLKEHENHINTQIHYEQQKLNRARQELATTVSELATAKHEVETAFKNTVKAQLRCQQVSKDLLAAFQKKQTTSSNLDNAKNSAKIAEDAYNSVLTMSQDAQKIMIQSKYTTNDTKINSKDIKTLIQYLPMTNAIDVKQIINTMNELSLGIAKKYNQAALEEQSPTKPTTAKGGKQIYLVKSNSVKANAHLHKNKGRTIRRYRIHY